MSIDYPTDRCRTLKSEYDACFNAWFAEKFLRGKNNDSACAELLKVYTQCIQNVMKEHNIHVNEIGNDYFETDKKKSKSRTNE